MSNRQEPPKHVTEGGKESKKNSDNNKSPFGNVNAQRLWLVLGVLVLALFLFLFNGRGLNFGGGLPLNELAEAIKDGTVASVTEKGARELLITYTDASTDVVYKNPTSDFQTLMLAYGVSQASMDRFDYKYEPADNTSEIIQILLPVGLTLFVVWFLWRMMRSMRAGQDQAMSFGRSKPRVSRDMERPQVTFKDVAGAEEAKDDLTEVVGA